MTLGKASRVHRRIGVLFAAGIAVSACGGRADLPLGGSSSQAGGGTSAGGTGGTGGAGAAGGWEQMRCSDPRWSSTQVRIPVPDFSGAETLDLIAMDVGQSRVALVSSDRQPGSRAIVSWAIEGWQEWPPQGVNPSGAHFPLFADAVDYVAVRHDDKEFGFATIDPSASRVFVGRVDLGNNEITIRERFAIGRLVAYANQPFSPFMIGAQFGPMLTLDWFPPDLPNAPENSLQYCVDAPRIQATALSVAAGGILTAVNANSSDCSDPGPIGPPTSVQVRHFASNGSASVGTTFLADDHGYYGGPVDDLRMVTDGDGGILSFRGLENPNSQPIHTVAQLDRNGGVVVQNTVVAEAFSPRRFVSWPIGYVQTWIDTTGLQSELRISMHDWIGSQAGPGIPLPGDYRGAPAIIAAPDGRSFMVAAVYRGSTGNRWIELNRADCFVVGE